MALLPIILATMALQPSQSSEPNFRNYINEHNLQTLFKYMQPSFTMDELQSLAQPTDWQNPHESSGREYDFIIVGSGSAGSVIANRLTENPDWHVLLLEAGKGENALVSVPALAATFQFTHYDWQYLMEYDPGFARGMDKHLLAWPRGRALGGTSVINYMIYTRGNPLDYDRWAAQGNPGWSYEDVLPYFKKSQRSTVRFRNPAYHNSDGYMNVEDSYQSPLVDAFVRAGSELGFRTVDYNSADQMGFSTIQATTLLGRRQSAARAFLLPIKHRPNLHIYTSAHVTRILIDPLSRQAYGVEYERYNQTFQATAKKEVILSAGAFSSAQLLMLSGIGPRDHLEELGIPVLEDSPVGNNLHDHITYVGLIFKINETISLTLKGSLAPDSLLSWMSFGEGPIANLGGVEGIAYVKTNVSQEVENYPDIELLFVGGSQNSDYGLIARRSMRIRDDVYQKLWGPINFTPTWTVFPMLLHPKSIGYMRLRSKDPFAYPRFYGNYLSDPEETDMTTLIAAIRLIIELSRTEAFQKYGSELVDTPVPGCEGYWFGSDQYWQCAIRTLSITLHHQVGTCKMGPNYDQRAVVNPKLQVYGVKGLRVADASVMPFAVGAHSHAPCVMIGEKASDLIKEQWYNQDF